MFSSDQNAWYDPNSKYNSVSFKARWISANERTLMQESNHLYAKQGKETLEFAVNEMNQQETFEDLLDAKLVSLREHRVRLGLPPHEAAGLQPSLQ